MLASQLANFFLVQSWSPRLGVCLPLLTGSSPSIFGVFVNNPVKKLQAKNNVWFYNSLAIINNFLCQLNCISNPCRPDTEIWIFFAVCVFVGASWPGSSTVFTTFKFRTSATLQFCYSHIWGLGFGATLQRIAPCRHTTAFSLADVETWGLGVGGWFGAERRARVECTWLVLPLYWIFI